MALFFFQSLSLFLSLLLVITIKSESNIKKKEEKNEKSKLLVELYEKLCKFSFMKLYVTVYMTVSFKKKNNYLLKKENDRIRFNQFKSF